ncbi:MAG: hypothetical protein J7527_12225, partial [Chitinophagaceae bacterium]|nr:hypothetical protein [Chitinophagaceae bacterium]
NVTPRLKNAIDNLYSTFSIYPGNRKMQASPLYNEVDKWNHLLFSKPLRQLSSDDLSNFLLKAISTWGKLTDLKHFLPRILELIASGDPLCDTDTVYQKLLYANWKSWESSEQDVINEFDLALWENLFSDEDAQPAHIIQEVFTSLLLIHPDIRQLLDIWMKNDSLNSISSLTDYFFIHDNVSILSRDNSGIDSHVIDVLKQWIISDNMLSKLSNAFFLFEDPEIQQQISYAIKLLEHRRLQNK